MTKPERDVISLDQSIIRARRRTIAAQLTSARATASIGAELYDWITSSKLDLSTVVVPDLDQQDSEAAAAILRASWGRDRVRSLQQSSSIGATTHTL